MKIAAILLAFLTIFSVSASAQIAPAALMPVVRQQFLDQNGHPLAGGKIHTYNAGTTTPLATYVDPAFSSQNQNPVILDASGEAVIWLSAQLYKICVADINDVQQYCVDQVSDPGALAFSKAVLLAPPGRAMQTVVGPLGADYFVGILPHTTSPGVRVAILDPTFVLDTATNPPTVIVAPPASPNDVINWPDPGAPISNVVLSPGHGTANVLDCTLTGLTCFRTANIYFEGGACNNTTASLGWDTFGTNSPTALCVTGTNIQKGVLALPSAATLIQQASGTGTAAGTGVVTIPAATVAGDLLTVAVYIDGTHTVSGCTDGTNAYTQAIHNSQGAFTLDIWYFNGTSTSITAATNLTCTFSGASNSALKFTEYGGILTAAALDKTSTATGTSTAPQTGNTAGTTQNTELLLAAVGSTNAPSVLAGTGYSLHTAVSQSTNVTVASEGAIQQAAGVQTAAFTLGTSQIWISSIATFKVNVASSTAAQRQFALPTFYDATHNVGASLKWQAPLVPTGTVTPSLSAAVVCTVDGGTDDPFFNAATVATPIIPISTQNVLQTTVLSPLVATGCAPGGLMHFQIGRNRYAAADTYEGYIYVNGATLNFGITQ